MQPAFPHCVRDMSASTGQRNVATGGPITAPLVVRWYRESGSHLRSLRSAATMVSGRCHNPRSPPNLLLPQPVPSPSKNNICQFVTDLPLLTWVFNNSDMFQKAESCHGDIIPIKNRIRSRSEMSVEAIFIQRYNPCTTQIHLSSNKGQFKKQPP